MAGTEELLKYAASLGVGGLVAVIMFLIYRKDMTEQIANWKGQSEALMTVVKDNTRAIASLDSSITELMERRGRGRASKGDDAD